MSLRWHILVRVSASVREALCISVSCNIFIRLCNPRKFWITEWMKYSLKICTSWKSFVCNWHYLFLRVWYNSSVKLSGPGFCGKVCNSNLILNLCIAYLSKISVSSWINLIVSFKENFPLHLNCWMYWLRVSRMSFTIFQCVCIFLPNNICN